MNRKIRIRQELYRRICRVFHYSTFEKGGLLGIHDHEIVSCYLDRKGSKGIDFYKPDPWFLRENIGIIQQNCDEFSFIHSHPEDWPLSYSDISYIRKFLELNHKETGYTALLKGEELEIYQIGPAREIVKNELIIF